MVTIFKNVATTITTVGDYFLYGQLLTPGIMASVLLMVNSLSILESKIN